ncbi:MAG: hypothetical protein AAGG69_00515 [Pseudomonadota bacterium]
MGVPEISVWVTAGCFNVVICIDHEAKEIATKVKRWANKNRVAYEAWSLDDGVIKNVKTRPLTGEIDHIRLTKLSQNAKAVKNDFLQPALQENMIASATALTRSFSVHRPTNHALDKVIDAMNGVFDAYAQNNISTLDFQARILSMNAAMSRFSSQAFSGVPPIQTTECHFWVMDWIQIWSRTRLTLGCLHLRNWRSLFLQIRLTIATMTRVPARNARQVPCHWCAAQPDASR